MVNKTKVKQKFNLIIIICLNRQICNIEYKYEYIIFYQRILINLGIRYSLLLYDEFEYDYITICWLLLSVSNLYTF